MLANVSDPVFLKKNSHLICKLQYMFSNETSWNDIKNHDLFMKKFPTYCLKDSQKNLTILVDNSIFFTS